MRIIPRLNIYVQPRDEGGYSAACRGDFCQLGGEGVWNGTEAKKRRFLRSRIWAG
jgi:hypothetical protein